MTKPNSPNTPNKYYFYSDATKIVWYSDFMPDNSTDLVYLGMSDNPKYAMAAAIFMKDVTEDSGYSLAEITE